MNENYTVRKVLKALDDVKRTFYGDEIEYLDGSCHSLEEAKQAIKRDKEENGDKYRYAVAKSEEGRNQIIHEE